MANPNTGMRARRMAAGIVLISCAAGISGGKAQAPKDSQGSPAVTFQVEVDYVDVDVVVTDQQGNFVRGLTRDDFDVLEDGKPVKIDTFSTVEIPVERYDTSRFGGRAFVEDVRSNRAVLGGRFYVIVLDDIGTSPLRSQYVIRAARQFVERHFAANDTAAVVYTSARRDRAQEFTSDRALLLAAIDKFTGTKLRSSTMDKLDGYYQELALSAMTAQTGEPADPSASPFSRGQGYPNRTYDQNDMERGQRALGVLGQLKSYAEFLANVRGRRKAMVLFSEGIDYPVQDIFAAHDATNVLRAMEDAIAAAARSNVNIFTVDPRGLVGLTSEYIELNRSNSELFNVGARDARFGLQPHTALLAEMRQTQDSLRSLAEQTGGLAAIDTNSFQSSFERIVQANSLYYMIGYYPPNHPRDGRFHKIEVRAKRAGLQVSARNGYASARGRAPAEREKIERERLARANMKGGAPDLTSWELREALNSPLQRGGLTLAVHAAPFRKADRIASVALAIEIDAARIQFASQNDKKLFANKVELSLFSISEQGKPMRGIRTELDLNLRPESYERVKAHGLRVNSRVDLAPGRYQLRVGVREAAGDTGTVFYDLDVPDFGREPLMMSGLLLTAPSAQRTMTVQPDEAVSTVLTGAATSSRSFVSSDVLSLYAEIYASVGQITPRIDVTTRLIAESGREVSVARDELTRTATNGRDKSATYSLSKSLPLSGVPPGAYLLRVEAQQRGDSERIAVRDTPITVLN